MEQRIKRTKTRPLFLAAVFLTAVAMSLLLQAAPAFAADGDAEEYFTVAIVAGEHGSVNGHTGSFSESVKSGENLTLTMQADDGYVIENVLVNETELEEEDLGDVVGKTSGDMTLEEIVEDMSVEVTFKTGESADEGSGDATDPEPGADETGGDGTDDPEDPAGAGADDPAAADTPDPAGTETDDPAAADPADTDGDSGAEDGTNPANPADPAGQGSDDTGSDGSDAQSGEDGSAVEDKPEAEHMEDNVSKSDDKETVSEGKAGKGSAAPDKGSSYVSDSSPKTGDSLPMKAIAFLIASLGMLCALAADRILRRRHHLQD